MPGKFFFKLNSKLLYFVHNATHKPINYLINKDWMKTCYTRIVKLLITQQVRGTQFTLITVLKIFSSQSITYIKKTGRCPVFCFIN